MLNDPDIIERQINRAEKELVDQRLYSEDDDGMAVLFTGNHHDSSPRYLVVNQELSPVEKITWQVIRLTINDPSRPGSTPRRAELASKINCSAPTLTVSRNMLRIQRWMTLCKTVRRQGRFVGDIYLLHDEPLSLNTTLQFDPQYVQFLESQVQSSTKRLREAAARALEDVEALTTSEEPVEKDLMINRLDRMFTLGKNMTDSTNQRKNLSLVEAEENEPKLSNSLNVQSNTDANPHQSKNFAAVETHQRKNLSPVNDDQRKNFALDEKKKISFASGSSSSFINNKYISNARGHAEGNQDPTSLAAYLDIKRMGRWGDNHEVEVAWLHKNLPWLTNSHFTIYTSALTAGRQSCLPALYRKLKKLPMHSKELVIFQLLGATAAAIHGWREEIRDPIAYAHKLIVLQESNELVPDEWALEFMRCYHDQRGDSKPKFINSPDLLIRRGLLNE